MQVETHDPGGRSAPRLNWKDINGRPTVTHPFVAKAVQRQLNRADREGASVQSSIVTPMTIYDDPIVQKTISRSDFKIRDLVYGEKPMSLYLKIPQPDRDRLRPLVRLVLQLIFARLMEQPAKDRHHLLLMLDEFPELKKIPNLASAMSLMAGYKIKPYLIAQTLTQIREEYGENESITDNCYIKAAFQTDNLMTCKSLSELSGNMTIEKETVNYSGQRTDFVFEAHFPKRRAGSKTAYYCGRDSEDETASEGHERSGQQNHRARRHADLHQWCRPNLRHAESLLS